MTRLEEAEERLAAATLEWSAKKAEYEEAERALYVARTAMNAAGQHARDARVAVYHERWALAIRDWAKPDLSRARCFIAAKLPMLDVTTVQFFQDQGIVECGRGGVLRYNASKRELARHILEELAEEETSQKLFPQHNPNNTKPIQTNLPNIDLSGISLTEE